jgi:hypothetical protein
VLKPYEHSGSLGISLPLILLGGISGAVILAAIYSAAIVYVPIGGTISFIFTFAFAFGLGYMNSWLGYLGKCRNIKLLNIMGLGTALVGLYWAWVFFVYFLLSKTGAQGLNLLKISTSPLVLFDVIKSINSTGWFTIKGATPSGIVLWILWSIEALIVFFFAFAISSSKIDERVFCEACNEWAPEGNDIDLELPYTAEEIEQIALGEFEIISQLYKADKDFFPRLIVKPVACGGCTRTRAIRLVVAELQASEDNKKPSPNFSHFAGPFVVPEQDYSSVLNLENADYHPVEEESVENQAEPEA